MMDFARSPRVFSPIHHDLPFLLIRSHNNTEISITLTRNSYLTDQYAFHLDAVIAYYHIRLSSIASYHLFMDLSTQHSFLVTPLCPFATCDLGGVTPAPPIRLKWPDPIDGTLICRVATHSDYTPQWHSHRHHSVWWRWGSTHYYARGGTTTRGDHPRTSPIRFPLLVLPESLDDYDATITSSYNTCDYVI